MSKYIEVWGTCSGGTFVAGQFKCRYRLIAIKKAIKKHGPDYTYYTVGNKNNYYMTTGNNKIIKKAIINHGQ